MCAYIGRFHTALFSQAPWLQQFISFVSSSLFTYWMKRGVKSFVGHDVIMILFKYQRYFLPHEPAATSICEISKKGQFFTMGIYFRVWLVGWFGQTKTNGKKAEKPSSYKYIGYRHAIDWYSKPFTVARVPFLLFSCQTCSALLFMKIRFPRQNLLFIFVYASAFGS